MPRGKRTTGQTRPKLPEELLAEARRALAALETGLTALDEHDDLSALLPVALSIRLLLGEESQLRRLCAESRKSGGKILTIPLVEVTEPVDPRDGWTLATGCLPMTPGPGHAPPMSRLRVTELMSKCCLVVTDENGSTHSYSWGTLLREIAYKLGLIHSDDEIPIVLDEIFTYQVGELRLPDFMIRALGVIASQAAHSLLSQVDSAYIPRPFSPKRKGMEIGGVRIRGRL